MCNISSPLVVEVVVEAEAVRDEASNFSSKSLRLITVANLRGPLSFLFLLALPAEQVKIIFSPVICMIRGSVVMFPYGVINCRSEKMQSYCRVKYSRVKRQRE